MYTSPSFTVRVAAGHVILLAMKGIFVIFITRNNVTEFIELNVGDVVHKTTFMGEQTFEITRVTKTIAAAGDVRFKRKYWLDKETGYTRIEKPGVREWGITKYKVTKNENK